ncbi:MAG: hypothetical protein KME26_09400 [Oscillatoria princeps RMCB-10]|nr:hypothetical protein [Oscillatoria princeps RMCB-10]
MPVNLVSIAGRCHNKCGMTFSRNHITLPHQKSPARRYGTHLSVKLDYCVQSLHL